VKTKYADFILFNQENKILILKRSVREDIYKPNLWVIPGGHVDEGESFIEAAKRELKEESGITIDKCYNVGKYEDDKCHIEYFSCSINSIENNVILDDEETVNYNWVDFEELEKYDMIFNMKENILNIFNKKENIDWKEGKQRNFKFDDNSTEKIGKFTLYPFEKLIDFSTEKSDTEGINLFVGINHKGEKIIQSLKFDLSKFSEKKAKKWWDKNKDNFVFYQGEEKTENKIGDISENRKFIFSKNGWEKINMKLNFKKQDVSNLEKAEKILFYK
jgi:8-oxo-dGTP pyrophosphatase MutT (NUDIX family)